MFLHREEAEAVLNVVAEVATRFASSCFSVYFDSYIVTVLTHEFSHVVLKQFVLNYKLCLFFFLTSNSATR